MRTQNKNGGYDPEHPQFISASDPLALAGRTVYVSEPARSGISASLSGEPVPEFTTDVSSGVAESEDDSDIAGS